MDRYAYNPQPTASDIEADKIFEKSIKEGCKVTFYDAAGNVITPDDIAFYAKRARADVKAPEMPDDGKPKAPFKIERVERDEKTGRIISQGEATPGEMAAELKAIAGADVVTVKEQDGKTTVDINARPQARPALEILVCAACGYQGYEPDFAPRVGPGALGIRCKPCWNKADEIAKELDNPPILIEPDRIGKPGNIPDGGMEMLAVPWPQQSTPAECGDGVLKNMRKVSESIDAENGVKSETFERAESGVPLEGGPVEQSEMDGSDRE